jgi:hypothetical protein
MFKKTVYASVLILGFLFTGISLFADEKHYKVAWNSFLVYEESESAYVEADLGEDYFGVTVNTTKSVGESVLTTESTPKFVFRNYGLVMRAAKTILKEQIEAAYEAYNTSGSQDDLDRWKELQQEWIDAGY